jgi:hypothetical protein
MKPELREPDVVSRGRPFSGTGTHRFTAAAFNPRICYSNEKMCFQSFFMLTTVQFFFLASA